MYALPLLYLFGLLMALVLFPQPPLPRRVRTFPRRVGRAITTAFDPTPRSSHLDAQMPRPPARHRALVGV
jgi:hypothetical protein